VGVQVLNERRKKKLAMLKYREKHDGHADDLDSANPQHKSDPSAAEERSHSGNVSLIDAEGDSVTSRGMGSQRMGGGMKVASSLPHLDIIFLNSFAFSNVTQIPSKAPPLPVGLKPNQMELTPPPAKMDNKTRVFNPSLFSESVLSFPSCLFGRSLV
jgi:hypothetical protein